MRPTAEEARRRNAEHLAKEKYNTINTCLIRPTTVQLTLFAKKVALAIEKTIPCQRIGVAVLGLEVPHAHIHLVPLQTEADISFTRPKLKLEKEEMETIAANIRRHL
jgi:diadenosine tetraphosphate (Ap4A) HIT family hydrolase